MKKGQAAMEFLMTYGWAILVVLAAIGALAYFGVLNPSRLIPNKCTLSPGFDFGDCKAATTGLVLTLHNGLGVDLTAFNITINTTGSSDIDCITQYNDTTGLGNGATTSTITLCGPGPYTVNQRFDADVKVTYIKSGGSQDISYSNTGTINRKIEP